MNDSVFSNEEKSRWVIGEFVEALKARVAKTKKVLCKFKEDAGEAAVEAAVEFNEKAFRMVVRTVKALAEIDRSFMPKVERRGRAAAGAAVVQLMLF